MPESEFHSDYEFLRKQQRLTYDEIIQVVRVATALGVGKIRLTGGEPLLDKNIAELIGRLTDLPLVKDLAMTTTGCCLLP